ncbi:MAG: hypothetical protein OXU67_09375 [Chloroflexota bacterium]|nr:hypothetical protein [Chloroflexota bacterium]
MVFRVMPSSGSFRPWAIALAVGLLAATVGTQPDVALWEQSASTLVLTWVRYALGWMWAAYVALLVGQATVALMQRRARRGASPAPIPAFLVTIQQSKITPGPLPLRQVVDRAILITGLTLPRFLHDLPSGTVMAFWLVVLLTCGYLALDGVLAPHRQRWYWWGTAFAVALWGIGSLLSPSGFWYPG